MNSKKAKLERDIDDNNATLTSCTSWLEGYEKKEEEILSSTKELSSQYLAERKILDKETAMYKGNMCFGYIFIYETVPMKG